jgi:hypothetical protein
VPVEGALVPQVRVADAVIETLALITASATCIHAE